MEIIKHNIFFTKTAKTATESIRNHLRDYAHDSNLVVNDLKYQSYFLIKNFNINTNHIHSNEKYINHFNRSINGNLPTIKITSVRIPIERLYSHYCFGNPYFKMGMDFNEWYIKISKRQILDYWDVPEWGDKTNNYMYDYMNLQTTDEVLTKYDFVFVKEKFDYSLHDFGKILNYDFGKTKFVNISKSSKENYKFDSETISLFEENNQKDIELYDMCYKRFIG